MLVNHRAYQRYQAGELDGKTVIDTRGSLVVKQLLVRSGKVFLQDVPAPTVGPKNILVRVERSCVSVGTEMAGIKMSGLPLYRRALKQPHHVKKALQLMKDQGFARVYKQIKGRLDAGTADRLFGRRNSGRGRQRGRRRQGRRPGRLRRGRHRQPCRNHRRAGQSGRAGSGRLSASTQRRP